MPKISVIIPIYNSEKVLKACLNSVIHQSFIDFEVLLINDGSIDDSGNICDDYAKRDNRIKVFHKENGGVSSARNIGIGNARGEWVTFIDSDDIVEEDFLKNFVITRYTEFSLQGMKTYGKNKAFNFKFVTSEIDIKQFFKTYTLHPFFSGPTSKLFKLDIINNLKFDESISFGEDSIFVLSYLKHIKNISLVDKQGYIYNNLENSLSNKKRSYIEMQNLYLTIRNEMEFFGEVDIPKHLRIITELYFVSIYSDNSLKRTEKLTLLKEIKYRDLFEIYKNLSGNSWIIKILIKLKLKYLINLILHANFNSQKDSLHLV